MAARSLKHYGAVMAVGASVDTAVGAAPAAGRALVISKITVTAANAALVFSLRIGATYIAEKVTLNVGDYYEAGGHVLLAGETVGYSVDAAFAGTVGVSGEEVDN